MKRFRIGIFASGAGSNALNIIRFFKDGNEVEVGFVLSNKTDAPVITKSENEGIKTLVLGNEEVANGLRLAEVCQKEGLDFIVLAGFLRKVPKELIDAYPDRIINIHPSLLPKFGGKGMYGKHVHQAVLAAGESESGITIHLVNEEFDKGKKLAQFKCPVQVSDTVETLEYKIRELELKHFPQTIKDYILKQND